MTAERQPVRRAPISVELLGTFGVTVIGRALELPLSAQRLVAFLALNRRPVNRTFAAEHLWPGGTTEHARSSLRAALWRARHCGGEIVSVSNGTIELAPEVEVDVAMQVECAHRVLDPSAQLTALDRRLLEADLLPDWYDDWVSFERDRLRQLRLHALEVFAEKLSLEHRFGEAVEAALACVRVDPLRESAHRILTQIFLAEGNVVEAIRRYEAYSAQLERELSLRPSEQFATLVADHTRQATNGSVTTRRRNGHAR